MSEEDQRTGKWSGGALLLIGTVSVIACATDLLAYLLQGEAVFIYYKGDLAFFGMEAVVMTSAFLVGGVLLTVIGWKKYRHG